MKIAKASKEDLEMTRNFFAFHCIENFITHYSSPAPETDGAGGGNKT